MKRAVYKFKGVSIAALIVGFLFGATPAWSGYVAYSDGRPLPENIDDMSAKDLLNVEWGDYAGNKTRVGVLEVDNTSNVTTVSVVGAGGTVNYSSSSGGVPVQGIEAILSDVLLHSGRFRIVERTKLDSTLREQDLGASGRVSKPSSAKIGKVLGAQYLIQGVVTHYEPNYEGRDVGVGGLLGGRAGALLGGIGVKSSKSMVGMNFRLINAETSEVVFSKQVESVIAESGLTFGGAGFGGSGALGGFVSNYSKTPIGQAVIAAINKGVYELVKQVGTAPARGAVIKASGSKVYINMGRDRVSVGERLKVMSKGEELIDPETGISLGGEMTELGMIEVVSVKKKYSIARPVSVKASQISKADPVISTRQPEGLRFGGPWEAKKTSSGGGSSGSSGDDAPAW